MKRVYTPIASDFVHTGILNVIRTCASLGEVTVGVLTDEVIATYKRVPMLDWEARAEIFSNIKGVDHLVKQDTLSLKGNLLALRPDYVVHGDDWRTGIQSSIRQEVEETLAQWGGELIEVPYTIGVSSTGLEEELRQVWGAPDSRRGRLRRLLSVKPCITAMEASNGLSGLIVENAHIDSNDSASVKEFDAMWISSLCDSAFKGKPDIELVDFTSRIRTVEDIMEVTTKPIIFDGDTGGRKEHFMSNVRTLERLGVSAVIVEDKTGLKQNSLFGTSRVQTQDDPHVFAEKLAAGKSVLRTKEFMIIARIESLIAGAGLEDALDRARIYLDEGRADAIMIHSKSKDGDDILEFMGKFRAEWPDVPLVVVPTAYNHLTEKELASAGANIIIYANHLLRAAYPAMQQAALTILENGRSLEADPICLPLKEVLTLIPEVPHG